MTRPPRSRGRVEVLAALMLLLGILFAGGAWAVYSDQGAENQQTANRIATIEASESPGLPVAVVPATPTPGGPPTATIGSTTGGDSILQPEVLTPTAVIPPPNPTSVPSGATEIPTLTPSTTPHPDMPPPTHIYIPAVGVNTDVVQVSPYPVEMAGVTVLQWNVADYAAGHHDNSADPGEGGNVVMSGHDDYRGEVFRGLHDARIGDDVFVDSPAGTFHYIIREIYLRKEKGEPLSAQLDIGVWMGPMPEERLTLITCWPYGVDDHRMIIVAKPAQDDVGQNSP